MNPTSFAHAGVGTQTAALKMGGAVGSGGSPEPPAGTNTQEYDGSSWTTGGSMLSANKSNQGSGTQTAALTFGGNTTGTLNMGYDGTSFSTRPSLATGRTYFAGFGTNTAAIACGNNPASGITEEFTGRTETVTAKTLTTG